MTFLHALLLCSFFFYIWLFGDTRLIYHAFGRFVDYPAFFTGWKFFATTIDHPGGVVEYVTGFLSQFYYYPVGGAIVITIVISLTCLATAMLVRFSGFNWLVGIVGYTPAIFFLAMHAQCEHPLGFFVALLINLWALLVYEKIRMQNFASRGCLFLLIFVLMYLVAAAGAFIFAILATGYEMFIRRRFLSGGVYILLTGLLPMVVGWCFDLRATDIYLYSLPFDPNLLTFERGFSFDSKMSAGALYVSILCILLGLFVCQLFFSKEIPKKTSTNTEKIRSGWLRWLAGPVIIAAAIATVFLSTGTEKQHLQADFYAGNAMWVELLEYDKRFPLVSNNPVGNHIIIQALYHTGQLASEMFSYPYFKESLFIPPENKGNVRGYRRGIYSIRLLLLLGRVNVAEKEAYEIMENTGEYPELLWELAKINIAKRQPETARVFLEILSMDLIHGKKAKNMLKRLSEDPDLGNDEEIIRLRSVMIKKDHDGSESLETLMSDLLEVNPHNKIAFEYLMTYYLMARKVDKIAENIYRLRDFGYKKIPRHYEEAIMIHIGKTKGTVNAHGWKLDPQNAITAKQFMTAIRFNPPANPSSAGTLAPQFGKTYFFYYMFNQSGVGR
ncbi:MAG: DUF6057 family protein [Phycisphaerae bacterium]|nr:DUF6057 family protein [Phycisphaerae bacterium]